MHGLVRRGASGTNALFPRLLFLTAATFTSTEAGLEAEGFPTTGGGSGAVGRGGEAGASSRRRPFSTRSLVLAQAEQEYQPFEHLPGLDPSQLSICLAKKRKPHPAAKDLVFGRTFTDHMLEVDWDNKTGFHAPAIKPYQNMSLSPAASVLHYGLTCFEGLKAFKDAEGNVRLFRPELNLKRFNTTLARLHMPPVDADAFLELLKELLSADESWIPEGDGFSLYIRPTAIGSNENLGVTACDKVKLFVLLSPAGPYFKEGIKPVKLYADTKHVRAWPGGIGFAKAGANYAPGIMPAAAAARSHGCAQVLWLFGDDHLITEGGAMNVFFVIENEEGQRELVTPSLDRELILPGVTRQSVLDLAREHALDDDTTGVEGKGRISKVSERDISMKEVQDAAVKGKLIEAFCTGTAAIIVPISGLSYMGEDIHVPTGKWGAKAAAAAEGSASSSSSSSSSSGSSSLAYRAWALLTDIQYGRREYKDWNKVILPAADKKRKT